MTGREVILRSNERPRGTSEFREVEMDIGESPNVRTLRIRTLRCTEGDISRTLFCVMGPLALRNVNYMAQEKRGQLPMKVQLYLPYVLGTLRDIPASRCGETFLGSDFSYDDMRTWVPDEGFAYEEPLQEDGLVRVRGRCTDPAAVWRHGHDPLEILVSADTWFLMGIDYLSKEGRCVRTFRVEERTSVDGIMLPTRMTMADLVQNHKTSIRLNRVRYDVDCKPDVFEPGFRKRSREYLDTL